MRVLRCLVVSLSVMTLLSSVIKAETKPLVSNLRAKCEFGKTFVVFDKALEYEGKYLIYRSGKKISSIKALTPVGTIENLSYSHRINNIPYLVPEFGTLNVSNGLFVITPKTDRASFYAVIPEDGDKKTIVIGENSLAKPIQEKAAKVNYPFFQGYKRSGYFQTDIYAIWMDHEAWPLDKEDLGSFFTVNYEYQGGPEGLIPVYIYLHSLSAGWGGAPGARYKKGFISFGLKDHERMWWRGRADKRIMDSIKGYLAMTELKYDKNRIYLEGQSMGGDGAVYHSIVNGDLFAATYAQVPRLMPDVHIKLVNKTADMPPLFSYWALQDGKNFKATAEIPFSKAMKKNHQGYYCRWGNHGHSTPKDIMKIYNADTVPPGGLYRFKKNEAFPVFTNCSSDNDFGQREAVTNMQGQINLNIDWNSELHPLGINNEKRVDTATKFAMSFKAIEDCTADITFRRIQLFEGKVGEKIRFINTDSNSKVLQKGSVTVSESGLIPLDGLQFMRIGNVIELLR